MTNSFLLLKSAAVFGAIVLSHGLSAATEIAQGRSTMVVECKQEAQRGHYRQLLTSQTLQHKQRMTAICGGWLEVREGDRDRLLAECLAEAQRGPLYGRGGRADRGHVVKLREMCRSLHKA